MDFIPPTAIIPFPNWTQFTPTIPSLYGDVDSQEERIKRLCMELHKLVEYADYLGENINIDHEMIQQLEDAFQKFMESGFNDYYKQQVAAWISANFQTIMNGLLGHMLFFGLTQDGYFTAYIPEDWAFVLDTVADYSSNDYGRLEIVY